MSTEKREHRRKVPSAFRKQNLATKELSFEGNSICGFGSRESPHQKLWIGLGNNNDWDEHPPAIKGIQFHPPVLLPSSVYPPREAAARHNHKMTLSNRNSCENGRGTLIPEMGLKHYNRGEEGSHAAGWLVHDLTNGGPNWKHTQLRTNAANGECGNRSRMDGQWTMELKGIKASRMDISEIAKVPNSLAQQQRKDAAHSVEVLPPRNNVHCKLSPSLSLCVEIRIGRGRQRWRQRTWDFGRYIPFHYLGRNTITASYPALPVHLWAIKTISLSDRTTTPWPKALGSCFHWLKAKKRCLVKFFLLSSGHWLCHRLKVRYCLCMGCAVLSWFLRHIPPSVWILHKKIWLHRSIDTNLDHLLGLGEFLNICFAYFMLSDMQSVRPPTHSDNLRVFNSINRTIELKSIIIILEHKSCRNAISHHNGLHLHIVYQISWFY